MHCTILEYMVQHCIHYRCATAISVLEIGYNVLASRHLCKRACIFEMDTKQNTETAERNTRDENLSGKSDKNHNFEEPKRKACGK